MSRETEEHTAGFTAASILALAIIMSFVSLFLALGAQSKATKAMNENAETRKSL